MYEEQSKINLKKKSILKKAALYEKKRKNNKKYKGPTFEEKVKRCRHILDTLVKVSRYNFKLVEKKWQIIGKK